MSRLAKSITLVMGAVAAVSLIKIMFSTCDSASGKPISQRHVSVSSEGIPLNFRDKYFEPIFRSFEEASRKHYKDVPKKKFRNGHSPKAVIYMGTKWLRENWLPAHMEDIYNRMCPYTCNVTANLEEEVIYMGTKWLRENWLPAHMEDIYNRMCPYTCNVTANLEEEVTYMGTKWLRENWLPAHMEDIHNRMCPYTCNVTANLDELSSADAVLIHLWSVNSRKELLEQLGPRDPSQPWVMIEAETHLRANLFSSLDYREMNGVFNRTFYYRRDSDVLMVHGFIVRRGRDASLLPPHWVRQPELAVANMSRHIAVAFISDCHAFSARLPYIHKMQELIHVDIYGKCGNLTCGASRIARDRYRADTDECMRMAAQKYLFYLAFENALCKDYVTEKLYNLMYYPMVPVVLGGADYAAILPPHSYIDANKYSPTQLANKLKHLSRNPKEYQSYLTWKKYYQPSTVGGLKIFCDLCKRLHDEDFYEQKTIQNFHDWFVKKSYCQNPTIKE